MEQHAYKHNRIHGTYEFMNLIQTLLSFNIDILHLIGIGNRLCALKYACFDFHTERSTMIPFLSFIRGLDTRQK